jgi:hypothetical protein
MKHSCLELLFFIIFFLFFLPTPAHAAIFVLDPADKTVTSGDQFTVNLYLDTEGKVVNAADATLTYPQSIIWIDKIEYPAIFPLHLQQIVKAEGKVTFHFGAQSQGARFSGRNLIATLTLSTHTGGSAYLSFICDGTNNPNDANIWEADTGNDLVDCGRLNKGVYTVNAKVGASPSATPAEVCVPPSAPTGVKAQSGGIGQVNLSWNAVSNVSYYTVTYGLSSSGYIYGAPSVGNITSYTVSGLAAGRTYYLVLTAVNSCGSSGYSGEVAARAGGTLPVVVTEEKGGVITTPVPQASLVPGPSQATASATPSPSGGGGSPSPTGSPQAFIPPKTEPFWRNWDFWKKVGIVSVVLFIILVIVSALRGRAREEQPPLIPAQPGEPQEAWSPKEWPPVSPEAEPPQETQSKPPPFSSNNLGV